MKENLARLGRFEPGPRAARWLAEAGVEVVWLYEIPLTTQFRGIVARDGLILQGAGGLAEAAPFWNYEPAVARRWFDGAIAIAREGLPVAPAPVPLNVTVPIVPPEVAAQIVRESGCRTAKVKVADPRADLAADVERLRAVRRALDEVWGDGAAGNASGGGFMRCQSGVAPHDVGMNGLTTGGSEPGVSGRASGVGLGEAGNWNVSGEMPCGMGADDLAKGGNAADGATLGVADGTKLAGGGFGAAPHEAETNATDASGGKIRVDVNAAWTLEQARENLPRLVEAAGGLEYAEQPCRKLEDLATLQAEGVAPIAADETIRLAADPAQAIQDVTEAGLAAMILKAMPLGCAAWALAHTTAQPLAEAAKRRQRFAVVAEAPHENNVWALAHTTAQARGFAAQGVPLETVNRDRFLTASHSGGGDMRLPRTSPLVVVSSALDSGVGLLAGMSLATMLYQGTALETSSSPVKGLKNSPGGCFIRSAINAQTSVAMGLGTGQLMRGGILVEEPRIEAGMLIPPVNPQLNEDLPAPHATLAARWRERLEIIADT